MVNLLFGIHCHQPVGNFDYVIKHAFEKSYKPFLETLYNYPDFKFSIHYTGPLLEWIEQNEPEFFEIIREMVSRKQVEIFVSGFYEPVLASIPENDRGAQILIAREYAIRKFHYMPDGLWLTERVWDPSIVKSLIKSGINYVLVDDFHFLSAGFDKANLHGYYLTESEGQTLGIFPIDEKLRYLTPFRPVDETLKYLKELHESQKEAAIIFDDGEKFGIWPGTHDWVYKKGWLKKFIEGILSLDFVRTSTYREFYESHKPLGRAYLPTASYFEMSEWSLMPEKALKFVEFVNRLKSEGIFEENKIFVRGGIWQNFLVKYSEANRMHKKMVYISRELKDTPMEEKIPIYRAQCNDAYWHGIFGGLYLPHLRRANYSNLLEAERNLPAPIFEEIDIDCDGFYEIYARTKFIVAQIKPSYGGALTELSSLKQALNFQDILMRRFEHYHKGLEETHHNDSGVASIHEMPKKVDRKKLIYDWSEKFSLLDHFIEGSPEAKSLARVEFKELGDFVNQPYEYVMEKNGVKLHRSGGVFDGEKRLIEIEKDITIPLERPEVIAKYRISGRSGNAVFAVELNFSMPSADSKASRIILDGKIIGSFHDILNARGHELILDDTVFNTAVKLRSERETVFRIFPVYTVSQSESGLDYTYQETGIFMFFGPVEGIFENTITISIPGG